ncbi:dTDP-4-dehydrorhamnose 3,5-epimerase family protein [Patescibacteria group bacterium]|nr:dTDP-4-dehydrorhamnose 3,5-epimerase family protein [Patescibacteria group bacterium]
MKVLETTLNSVYLIKLESFEDYRGNVIGIWDNAEYHKRLSSAVLLRDETFINVRWKEIVVTTSARGVLRGIHWDSKRWKLCTCLYGKVYQVVVEPKSGKWEGFILSGDNHNQVLVPPKHGNSYQVLSDVAIFHYMMSEYYDPNREKTFRYDDPKFGINWVTVPPILSKKDFEGEI